MTPTRVSIVIPVYNQAQYLPEALDSVLRQTHSDWECIVIDDGSTDHTPEVIRSYAARDPRIRSVSQPNRGLPAARNAGIAAATGVFLQFLDADDAILPEKLAVQVERLATVSGPALSYTDYYYGQESDLTRPAPRRHLPATFASPDLMRHLILDWESDLSIPVHCFLFQTATFHRHGIRFDEKLANHEDWECWIRVFRLNPTVVFVDKQLAAYRLHAASMARDGRAMKRGFLQAIAKQQAGFDSASREHRFLATKAARVRREYRIYRLQEWILTHSPQPVRALLKRRRSS